MADINYNKLYKIQDKVLSVVFKTENIFYLTGGTCISRFYKAKRYSDDLDFFTDNSPRFSFALRKIKIELSKIFEIKTDVNAKDFNRIIIDNILVVDFVNERTERLKDVVITKENYLIDNIENILSNKLTAVICRDNPKDIFDIYLIWKYYKFNWLEIIEFTHKKLHFDDEELIIRLKTFPVESIKGIKLIDKNFLNNFEKEYQLLVNSIINYKTKNLNIPKNNKIDLKL